jgi:hypothetical protein
MINKKNIIRLSWIIVIIIAISIFYISSLTFKAGNAVATNYNSIVYHFFAFFWLAFFLNIALGKGQKNRRTFIFIAIIITIVYGTLDEFHQLYVPGRCCDFNDFLVDSAGALTSSFIYVLSLKSK